MESWVRSWRPRTNAFCDFAIFPLHLSKVLISIAPATKKWCQVIRSAAPVTQNHLSKPDDLMLQNATFLRKSPPWPPNISNSCVSCTATATRTASLQILFKSLTLAIVLGRTRRFSEPSFRPSGATNLPFPAPASSFFDSSSSLIFFLLLFSSLTFPTSAFPSVHIVGSLTSKLPSIKYYNFYFDCFLIIIICVCVIRINYIYVYMWVCVCMYMLTI